MLPRSLYIHVPFCTRRCFYCDFAVEAVRAAPSAEWLDSVVSEAELTATRTGWPRSLVLDTVYVGGGTPSLLGTGVMKELKRRLEPVFRWTEAAEWTCEANPESFSRELAEDWREAGVNRLSFGAQSYQENTLRWMGRLHGPDGPALALQAARQAGFDNVSIDLIFGLPAELERDWGADLRQTIDLAPEHVSLYGLTAEAGAPLGRRVSEGRERLADEDRYADEYLLAHELLCGAGYDHYEVSNFCQAGRISRHNFAYWTGDPYAALGPGAHAFDPPIRRWNVRSWFEYRDRLGRGGSPLDGEELVDDETRGLERLWLSLRTTRGVKRTELDGQQRRLAERWVDAGLASVTGDVLRLTAGGWLLLDRAVVDLHEAGGGHDTVQRSAIDAPAELVQIGAASKPSRR